MMGLPEWLFFLIYFVIAVPVFVFFWARHCANEHAEFCKRQRVKEYFQDKNSTAFAKSLSESASDAALEKEGPKS